MNLRIFCASLCLLSVGIGLAQEPKEETRRFGKELNLDKYPQKTPQDTLRSILKAIDEQKLEYVLAQLVNPAFVQTRLKDYDGNFDRLVADYAKKLRDDPESAKQLRKFLTDGTWEIKDDEASAKLPELKGRQARFKKLGERWYLENDYKPAAPKP